MKKELNIGVTAYIQHVSIKIKVAVIFYTEKLLNTLFNTNKKCKHFQYI